MCSQHRFLSMILSCLVGLTLLVGCTGTTNPVTPTPLPTAAGATNHRLRIINNSHLSFERLVVQFPADQIDFGRVESGATTEYLPVPNGVYGYAAYTFTVDGTSTPQPVTDWVGESPLEGSAFTYVLSVTAHKNGQPLFINGEVQRDE